VARISQFDSARRAAEQLCVNFPLDRFDLSTQRRLLNPEPFRGAGDVPFFGDRNDVTKVPQLHGHTLKVSNLYRLYHSDTAGKRLGNIKV
jgi:hypothetical protein